MKKFLRRQDGWWGIGYLISDIHTDGKVWKGNKRVAIKNYCNEYGIKYEDNEWFVYDEKKQDYTQMK